MKKFTSSDIIALLFIVAIGCFEFFYRQNLIDGYLALGMALTLFIYQIFQKSAK
jgi:hypothetical protein